MEINWAGFWAIVMLVVTLIALIVWKEHEVGIRLGWGSLRTWFSWLIDNVGVPPFCEHVKLRMVCDFCPFNVEERKSKYIITYCGIARVNHESFSDW